jgi:hypothetical protein
VLVRLLARQAAREVLAEACRMTPPSAGPALEPSNE